MHPQRRRRLIWILALLAGFALAVALAAYALRQNINLFFTPSQLAAHEAVDGQRIQAGGLVVQGSVRRAPDSLAVRFSISDLRHSVDVVYEGILPDLFKEGKGVVAQGKLEPDGIFRAKEVLAKHDENYMPPEAANAVERAQKAQAKDTLAKPPAQP